MHSLSCQLMVRISSLSAFSRAAAPLTVIVSRDFAARAGEFCFAKFIPYPKERPSARYTELTVTECKVVKMLIAFSRDLTVP